MRARPLYYASIPMRRRSGGRAVWSVIALFSLVAALVGCRRSTSGKTDASAKAALAPFAARSWLESLEAPGFAPAKVALPLGAKSPRPILVALHGDDDRPEWPCGSYHHVTRLRAFVVCPTGIARGDRFTLRTISATKAELRALLPALKARHGSYVAKGSIVLAALGPSVAQALEIALEEPSFFSHLVLIDGSLDGLTLGVAERFAAAGGKSVLVVCTQDAEACKARADERLGALERAGVETRVLLAPSARGLDGDVTVLLAKEFPSLVRGEPRWQ